MLFVRQASTPIFPELSRSHGTGRNAFPAGQSQEHSLSGELRGGRRRSVKESTSWMTDNGSWRHRSSPAPYIEEPPAAAASGASRSFKPRPLRLRDGGGGHGGWGSSPMAAIIQERKDAEELERRIQCVRGAFSKSLPSFTQPTHLRKKPVLSARLEELAKPREDKWLENETVESVVKAAPPRPKPRRGNPRVPALPARSAAANISTDEHKSPMSSIRDGGSARSRQSLQLQDDVRFAMAVRGVRYAELTEDRDLLAKFERAVKMAVASETFDKVLPEHISLALRADLHNHHHVAVHTTISPPSGVKTDAVASKIRYSQTLGQEVSERLSAVAGMEAVTSGPLRVASITGPEVVAPGASHREHSGMMLLTPTAGALSPNISTCSSREASLELRERSRSKEAKATAAAVPDPPAPPAPEPAPQAEESVAAGATAAAAADGAEEQEEEEEEGGDATGVAPADSPPPAGTSAADPGPEGEGEDAGGGAQQPVAVAAAKSGFSDGFEESEDDSRESTEDAAATSHVSGGAKQPVLASAVTYGDFEGSEGSEDGDGKQRSLPHSAYDSEDDFEDEESEQADSSSTQQQTIGAPQEAQGGGAAAAATGAGPAAAAPGPEEAEVEASGHEDYDDGDDFESDDD